MEMSCGAWPSVNDDTLRSRENKTMTCQLFQLRASFEYDSGFGERKLSENSQANGDASPGSAHILKH